MPDKLGRIQKGERLSPTTEFKKGQHWRHHKDFWERDWLYNEYIIQQRSASDIANQFGVNVATIYFWLNKHDIPRRTISEAREAKHWGAEGKANPMFGKRGILSGTWKGGITPERQQFYNSIEWRNAERVVMERDKNTCRRCGKQGKRSRNMHIHHIVPFQVEATRADPDNLVMLCARCHCFIHSKRNVNSEFIEKGCS